MRIAAPGSTAAQAAAAPLYTWQVTNVVEAATITVTTNAIAENASRESRGYLLGKVVVAYDSTVTGNPPPTPVLSDTTNYSLVWDDPQKTWKIYYTGTLDYETATELVGAHRRPRHECGEQRPVHVAGDQRHDVAPTITTVTTNAIAENATLTASGYLLGTVTVNYDAAETNPASPVSSNSAFTFGDWNASAKTWKIYYTGTLDYEAATSLSVRIGAPGTNAANGAQYTWQVTNVNDLAPTITTVTTNAIAENATLTASGYLLGTVTVSYDAAETSPASPVSSNSAFTFGDWNASTKTWNVYYTGTLDYEAGTSLSVRIAAPGSTAAQAATAPLYTWQVTNVVEAATVAVTTTRATINEGEFIPGDGILVGRATVTYDNSVATADRLPPTLSDPTSSPCARWAPPQASGTFTMWAPRRTLRSSLSSRCQSARPAAPDRQCPWSSRSTMYRTLFSVRSTTTSSSVTTLPTHCSATLETTFSQGWVVPIRLMEERNRIKQATSTLMPPSACPSSRGP